MKERLPLSEQEYKEKLIHLANKLTCDYLEPCHQREKFCSDLLKIVTRILD